MHYADYSLLRPHTLQHSPNMSEVTTIVNPNIAMLAKMRGSVSVSVNGIHGDKEI